LRDAEVELRERDEALEKARMMVLREQQNLNQERQNQNQERQNQQQNQNRPRGVTVEGLDVNDGKVVIVEIDESDDNDNEHTQGWSGGTDAGVDGTNDTIVLEYLQTIVLECEIKTDGNNVGNGNIGNGNIRKKKRKKGGRSRKEKQKEKKLASKRHSKASTGSHLSLLINDMGSKF
jgi:hypothetical protein